MRLPRHALALSTLALAHFALLAPLSATEPTGRTTLRAGGLSTEEEEQDAREIAERVNVALNLRREVVIDLLNGTSVAASGKVTARRYWLIITDHDGSEFMFRASLIASVRIR